MHKFKGFQGQRKPPAFIRPWKQHTEISGYLKVSRAGRRHGSHLLHYILNYQALRDIDSSGGAETKSTAQYTWWNREDEHGNYHSPEQELQWMGSPDWYPAHLYRRARSHQAQMQFVHVNRDYRAWKGHKIPGERDERWDQRPPEGTDCAANGR